MSAGARRCLHPAPSASRVRCGLAKRNAARGSLETVAAMRRRQREIAPFDPYQVLAHALDDDPGDAECRNMVVVGNRVPDFQRQLIVFQSAPPDQAVAT